MRTEIKLNIGCGKDIKDGFINVDQHKELGADLVHKLPEPLPFKKNTVDYIYCSHVLEDFLHEYVPIMKDFHRVLKKGGLLHIRVPYGLDVSNPYHVRFFNERSFKAFSGIGHYGDSLPIFKIKKQKINKRCGLFIKLISYYSRFNKNKATEMCDYRYEKKRTNPKNKSLLMKGYVFFVYESKLIKLLVNTFAFTKHEIEVILEK
ncbi:methyltransferase domain-containing protein [Nanoarchaeota archaeon]